MEHQSARQLFRYWNSLRGDRRAPARSALEPAAIRAILGDTFLLEVVDRRSYAFRLAGTRICSAYCRELKGQDFLTFWRAEDRDALAKLLGSITTDAAAGTLDIAAENERGQTVSLTALLLPLYHDGDELNRIVGVLAPIDPPYWLGMHPIVEQRIVGLRIFQPEDETTVVPLPLVPAAVPLQPGAASLRQRGPFVVVQGGKS